MLSFPRIGIWNLVRAGIDGYGAGVQGGNRWIQQHLYQYNNIYNNIYIYIYNNRWIQQHLYQYNLGSLSVKEGNEKPRHFIFRYSIRTAAGTKKTGVHQKKNEENHIPLFLVFLNDENSSLFFLLPTATQYLSMQPP